MKALKKGQKSGYTLILTLIKVKKLVKLFLYES